MFSQKMCRATNCFSIRRGYGPLRILFLIVLTVVQGFSAHAQLLHRYDFSTGPNDSVGTANGTLRGAATISAGALNTASVAGGLSGGVPQNGLLLPASAVAGITNAFTIESWFVANYGGGYNTLFSFSANNTANYVLATPARGNSPYASTISVIGGGGTATEQQASEAYQTNGALHQLVVTYDGTTLAYYIDGALGSFSGLSPTINDPGLNLSTLTYIGINGGSPWTDNSLNGSTLDFRIYGQALDPVRIANLYSLGPDASNSVITTALTNAVTSSVQVDPSLALTNYTGMGEWNTDGNFESWTTSGVSGATVSSGSLSGTGSANYAQVSLQTISGGPDLDLGSNDVVDVRLQLPASFAGDIHFYYGSTFASGINGSRILTILNANVPKDGAAHLYRLDLGLEVPWRGNLTDLRVELTSASGAAFALDYVRVGDRFNETYQPRYTSECPAAGGTTPSGAAIGPNLSVYSMESKHFRFLWNDAVATNASWTANMPHGTLRNAEECWQVMVRKLGYREPCFATETQSGTKYKLNITPWYSGYWEGGDTYAGTTLARLNITPDGLRVDPPTTVLPHEFTHCIQQHNTTGYVPGSWWEGHANYGRERYLEHYGAYFFSSNARSGIDPTYLRCAHQLIAEGRDYYLSWPMFLYLDENPDKLSDLGEGTMVKLWQQCQANEYPLMTLDRLTATNTLKDIVGYFARREATFNYKSKPDIQAALASFGTPLDNAATARWQFTDLVQRNDDPSWWSVPFYMAPMQGAYAIHELVPTGSGAGRVVTVNLHGLADSSRGADWRASFIVISDTGVERYSTLWGSGSNSVTLAANENKVYLSVAGAPARFYTGGGAGFQGDYDESIYPYRSWPSKSRFPYELQVFGATPKQRDNGSAAGLVQHSNGGGYKASGVTVPTSVYIGPNARVLGGSVSGNARIEDYALVSAGTVNGNAVISGHAWVRGGTVKDNAKVRDWALVEGGTIMSNARVLEHANIKGGTLTDLATAKGTAASLSGTLAGNALIDGDYGDFFYGRDLTNVIAFGHLPYVGVPDNFTHPLPTALYCAYDFATAHDSRILDQYGVTDGFTEGSPTWYAGDGRRPGFLAFNGVNQFVTLDRSVCDLRQFTIAAWVKWSGGAGNQPVVYFSTDATNCFYITPDDGSGHATVSLTRAGTTQSLAWTNRLPIGAWAHVALTLDGTNAVFYVNGTLAATAANTNRADLFLAPNTAAGLQQNYIARGAGNSLPNFQGALDDVRVYGAALAASDIAALNPPAGPTGTGTLYVDLRATNASAGAAATFTTWTNFGVTIGNFTKTGTTTYTNSVAGTQIPGVLFDGTSGLYSSANTGLADITGASDRSLEVWVYNPALASEETMVSLGDRSGTRKDCAFNFGTASGWGAVTHFNDDVGWGGTAPTANAWHHLVYTYDGNTNVLVYVDGALWASDNLAGVLVTPTGDPINIGCQRSTGAGGSPTLFFSGYLNTVRVWGGVMTPAQVTANYLFGPWLSAVPRTISFASIPNATLNPGAILNFTNSATDPNQPPLPLTFSILSAPTNAAINAANGLFTWRPTIEQANSTNVITLIVTNSANPSLAATQSFTAKVNAITNPYLATMQWANGQFSLQVNGAAGPDYYIQASTNLTSWQTLYTNNSATVPFTWIDLGATNIPTRFYRVTLGP